MMRHATLLTVVLLLLPVGAKAQAYEDHFTQNTLDRYTVTGTASVEDGVLQLKGPNNVEVYTDTTFGNALDLEGRVWIPTDHGKYGSVALAVVDEAGGTTYWATLTFGDQLENRRDHMSILRNDTFGALYPITLKDETWYRVKIRTVFGEDERRLQMKAWEDGTSEPDAWPISRPLPLSFGPTRVGFRHYGPGTQADDLVVHRSGQGTFDWKGQLPQPVLPERPLWEKLYWKAWEIASGNVQHGTAQNGFVDSYLDEGFNSHIFQWDTAFMMLFARYGHELLPTIEALDNFYRHQRDDGGIVREIRESNGSGKQKQSNPNYTNPPLFAWAELAYYRLTGDASRFDHVLPILDEYFQWCKRNRTRASGMYYWGNWGSGMDNAPRPPDKISGWIDYTAQQAMAARQIGRMAAVIGDDALEATYRQEFENLKALVNQRAWDQKAGYYWDVAADGSFIKNKTAASFWPMLAGITDSAQAAALKQHLFNPDEFKRSHLFPTLAADQPAYEADGGYWHGSVWAPTDVMYVKGLQRAGYEGAARAAAMNHLDNMATVYQNVTPHSIWENYAPEFAQPGEPARSGFVGWSGNGPITLLIENVLGIRAHAPTHTVTWRPALTERHGLRNLSFDDNHVNLIAEARSNRRDSLLLHISNRKRFTLAVVRRDTTYRYELEAGQHRINVAGAQAMPVQELGMEEDNKVSPHPYPNPFRTQTTLEYVVAAAGPVILTVYDARGRRVATLRQGRQSAGKHEVTVTARQLPAAGAYFYRLETSDSTRTGAMTLLK